MRAANVAELPGQEPSGLLHWWLAEPHSQRRTEVFTRERLMRWTNALRAHPEKQYTAGSLANFDHSKTCCLGELCEVEGLQHSTKGSAGYKDALGAFSCLFLYHEWQLAKDFGSPVGEFRQCGMPELVFNGRRYFCASGANDAGVPWPVIADHFDRYYPCSDEASTQKDQT